MAHSRYEGGVGVAAGRHGVFCVVQDPYIDTVTGRCVAERRDRAVPGTDQVNVVALIVHNRADRGLAADCRLLIHADQRQATLGRPGWAGTRR